MSLHPILCRALAAGAAVSLACTTTSAVASGSPDPMAAWAASGHASGGGTIRLPEGAGGDIAKRQLNILADISAIQDENSQFKISDDALQLARAQIEAQLPRMKRFTVYSLFNDKANRTIRLMEEGGIAKEVERTQLPPFDLELNVVATLRVEVNLDKPHSATWYTCSATVVYALADTATRKILADTQYASGTIKSPAANGTPLEKMPNVRKVEMTYNPIEKKWETMGGWDPKSPDSVSSLVKQTIENPLKGLVARLAMALPLTTEVTGLTPTKTQFSIKAGQKNGVFRGGKVIVWCQDGDFSFPIAETEAEPAIDRANLKIVKWNDGDADAKVWVDKIRSGGITDDLKGKLWATTEGIPLEEQLAP